MRRAREPESSWTVTAVRRGVGSDRGLAVAQRAFATDDFSVSGQSSVGKQTQANHQYGRTMMRRVTAGLFYSLDGVVEAPHVWQYDSFDGEVGAEMTAMIGRTDTVLLGRVGYQEWSGYWPNADADDGFAKFINPVEKFVASRTPTGDLEWQNSQLVDGSLDEFVAALREADGGEISVCGGISVVRHLLFAGLLDTLTLIVHPVIAGAGRHLFEPDDPATRLTLDDARRTTKGNTILSYRRRSG